MKGMKGIVAVVLVAGLMLAVGCRKTESDTEPQAIVDLRSSMRDYALVSEEVRDSMVAADREELSAFMLTLGVDSISDSIIEVWSTSRVVEAFTPMTDSVFPTLTAIESSLGAILTRAERQGLSFPVSRYAAVVYGRPESILFVDSVMLIALNHYLGADFAGYSHIPFYRRAEKTPEQLPYDMAEALVATAYPNEAADDKRTLLSALLYHGAVAYCKTVLVSGATEASALGYDGETYARLVKNEGDLWRQLVADRLLYDTSESTIDRLVAPAPASRVAGLDLPPRAGRFVGYRMVRSYLKSHPDASLEFLLSPDFYLSPASLAEASYNP